MSPAGLWPAQRRSTVQAPSCSASALAAGSPALHRQSRPLGLCFPGTQAEMPPPHAAAPEFSRDCRKVHQEPGQARHVIQAHSSPGAPASALTPAISGSAAHDPHFFPPSPDVPRFLFPQGLCLLGPSASHSDWRASYTCCGAAASSARGRTRPPSFPVSPPRGPHSCLDRFG